MEVQEHLGRSTYHSHGSSTFWCYSIVPGRTTSIALSDTPQLNLRD